MRKSDRSSIILRKIMVEVSNSTSVLGGKGNIEVASGGTFNWLRGTIKGDSASPSKLTLKGASTTHLNGSSVAIGDDRVIESKGTFIWEEPATIGSESGSVGPIFDNYGLFEVRSNRSISGVLTFNNKAGATVEKVPATGTTGDTNWDGVFNNDGTVDIQSGSITFGSGTSTGTFIGDPAATLKFDPTSTFNLYNATLTASSSIPNTGIGTVEFLGLGSNRAVDVNTSSLPNNIKIAGATVSFDSATKTIINNLELTSGTLAGTGEVEVKDTFNWTVGQIIGGGILTLMGETISGAGDHSITQISGGSPKHIGDSRTINNYGVVTWTGNGEIRAASLIAPTFNNFGTFDVQNDSTFNVAGGGNVLTFNNSGTVQKTVATGTSNWTSICYVGSLPLVTAPAVINISTGNPPCP